MGSLVNKYGWREWLCHTNYSFLIGASHPTDYVTRAYELGYRGLGVTDYDGIYGLAQAYRAFKDFKDQQGLSLFYGAELHLRKDHDMPCVFQDTIVLLALSHRGYHHLCKLLSYSHREGKHNAYTPLEDLSTFPLEDLVLLQPMRGLIRQPQAWLQVVKRYELLSQLFKGRSYMVISRHQHQAEDKWIKPAVELARRLQWRLLLSQDVFFHDQSMKDLSDVIQAVRLNKTLDESVPHMFVNSQRHLQSKQRLEQVYGVLPFFAEALENGKLLAEKCQFNLGMLRYHYPNEMIPQGCTPQEYLIRLVWQGARKMYGDDLPYKIQKSLQHELSLVEELQFADYFLTVWDIVNWARSQKILCQGRGSAANSAICFVLGITAIDPNQFELLFERFISTERGDPPDIDVDFEHERREEVIQYIYKRYGRGQAAMVANVITFKARGAIRAVGKALGFPEAVLGKASAILDSRSYRWDEAKATIGLVKTDEGGSYPVSDHLWSLWAELAERLKGYPRHLGIHSGGFMLADKPIDWLVAQEPATMPGRTVIQWCKDDIEALGFFKIDVLSLGMLTAIRKCLALITEKYGNPLTLATIPGDDSETYEMIQKADTVGVFQIESRAQMSMLPRLRPKSFYDLVVEVAIIRPGPIQGGMIHPYLRRRHGLESVVFPDPRLVGILERTHGIPIFQEQVMRIAIAVGGFTAGEADELRKNIGSFSLKADPEQLICRLYKGMRENGISEEFAQGIVGQIRGFASYGFPESHAASFALLAYASAYLKCHYPAAFFTALLNSQPMGFYASDTLLKTARHLGVKVLPVCVLRSTWDHTLELIDRHNNAYGIRLGLRQVNGLSEAGARSLLKIGSNVHNLLILLQQSKLSRLDLTALAAADALRAFGVERRAAIWLAEAAPYCEFLEDDQDVVHLPAENDLERVQADYAAMSTSIGSHPALLMREQAWSYHVPRERLTKACGLRMIQHNTMALVFGMVLVRQAPPTAKGMMFITMEDETGMINLVITPQIYNRFHKIIDGQIFLCALGRLENASGVINLMVKQFFIPQAKKGELILLDVYQRDQQEFAPTRNYM